MREGPDTSRHSRPQRPPTPDSRGKNLGLRGFDPSRLMLRRGECPNCKEKSLNVSTQGFLLQYVTLPARNSCTQGDAPGPCHGTWAMSWHLSSRVGHCANTRGKGQSKGYLALARGPKQLYTRGMATFLSCRTLRKHLYHPWHLVRFSRTRRSLTSRAARVGGSGSAGPGWWAP